MEEMEREPETLELPLEVGHPEIEKVGEEVAHTDKEKVGVFVPQDVWE